MVSRPIVEEEKVEVTIRKMPDETLAVLDLIKTFR